MAKIEKVCVTCGKSFSVWPNRADSAKTCSQPCRGVLIAKQYENARAKKICPACNGEFSVPQCHSERVICCSVECSLKVRKHSPPSGVDHYKWRGGRTYHTDWYLYVTVSDDHPFQSHGKYVFEHRVVMESWMKNVAPNHGFLVEHGGQMYLHPDIVVHHINENRRDNRITNLLACTEAAHRSIHNGQPPMQGEVWPDINGMAPFAPYKTICLCEVCGKKFSRKRTDVKRGNGRFFCSRLCYNNRPRVLFDVVPT